MVEFFTYVRQVRPRSPFGLRGAGITIRDDGQCTAWRTCGEEVGTYTMRTDRPWIDAFWASLTALDDPDLAAPALLPETPLVALGLGRGTEPPQLRGFDAVAVPESLRPLTANLDATIESLASHCHHGLRGAATWGAPVAEPGAPLRLDVSVTNPGTSTAAFANPTADGPGASLRLCLHRDVGEAAVQDELDIAAVAIPSDTLAMTRGPSAAAGPVLPLEPGQAATWALERAAYLEPGRYRAVLEVHLDVPDADPERAVDGSLRLPLPTLNVNH